MLLHKQIINSFSALYHLPDTDTDTDAKAKWHSITVVSEVIIPDWR